MNACGGDNFVTCVSGGVAYDMAANKITLHATNLSTKIDVFTSVGLFNLPGRGPTSFGGFGRNAGNGISRGAVGGPDVVAAADGVRVGSDATAGAQAFAFTVGNEMESYNPSIVLAVTAPGGCSTTTDASCVTTTVPEPSTIFLLGAGMAALGALRYRRRKGLAV